MKLNIETKPKEWLWIALFVLIGYCIATGKAEAALSIISRFLLK